VQSQLDDLLGKASLILSAQQKQQLVDYVALLQKWNRVYNLTSVRESQQILIRHIMDSLVVNPYLTGKRFIDVGTGPGLPGIPLAIARPESHFTLLDSLGKRIRFLKQVQYELGLQNITLVQSRVEGFMPELLFDGVMSRAFASLSEMLTWCSHLINPADGRFYALKGTRPDDELQAIPKQFSVESVMRLQIPYLISERHLVTLAIRQQ
jgi:16S rRNA (guanine527-N7)-methyltransferase